MNYPLISDYVSSILSAEDNFKELTNLRPVLDEEEQPIMSSGNFAVVFKMKDEQTGKLYAVKCFLKEQKGRAESYKLIEEELECISSNYLTPIRYMEDELFVDSSNTEETEFPVLLMNWVEGMTLDKYLRYYIGNIYTLLMLVYRFSRMASWLLSQPFAHGDLKCDNIIVKEDGTLVLVDYDGMYVPAMKGQKAREMGSPDFRHPKRTENDFDEHIDDFAISSILLSLKAISLNPDLLRLYGDSDRLLFSRKDYLDLSFCKVINALHPLMINDELNILLSLFLFAHSKRELPMIPRHLFHLTKPLFNNKYLNETDLNKYTSHLELNKFFNYEDECPYVENYEEKLYWFSLFFSYQFKNNKCIGNIKRATKWYLEAAKLGDANVQNNLGCLYSIGREVLQDYNKAFNWYLKAAKQGHITAQYNLGNCFYYGHGVTQNYNEAVIWYEMAAINGHHGALYKLGLCYELGLGVDKNITTAIKWYVKFAYSAEYLYLD